MQFRNSRRLPPRFPLGVEVRGRTLADDPRGVNPLGSGTVEPVCEMTRCCCCKFQDVREIGPLMLMAGVDHVDNRYSQRAVLRYLFFVRL